MDRNAFATAAPNGGLVMGKFAATLSVLSLTLAGGIAASGEFEDEYKRAIDYALDREYEKAIQSFDAALKLNPDDLEVRHVFGTLLLDQGLFHKAEAHFSDTLEIAPDEPRAHFGLGEVFLAMGATQKALDEYHAAVQLDRNYVDPRLRIASLYEGRDHEAAAELKTAIQINPQRADSYVLLGQIYLRNKQYQQAAEQFEKALSIDPNNSDAHYRLGQAYVSLETPEKAIKEYKAALQRAPINADLHYDLGLAYYAAGNQEESITHYARAIVINPKHLAALTNLGFIRVQEGDYGQAIDLLTRARAVNPRLAGIRKNLGLVYMKTGLFEEARREWEAVLRIDSSDQVALEQLQRLQSIT